MTDDDQQPKFVGHYHGDGFEPCADPDCEVAARAVIVGAHVNGSCSSCETTVQGAAAVMHVPGALVIIGATVGRPR